jgi:CheY-like chemotaxis protein
MADDVAIDQAALDRLRQMGGPKLVTDMVAVFLRNAPVRLAEARAALGAGRFEPVERAGHSLKSSCAYVGAAAMAGLARQLEAAGKAGRADESAGLLDAADRELAAVQAALLKLTASAAGSRRVAVVEDNPDNRLLVRALLDGTYQVMEYETGPEALDGLRREPVDLVLLDVSLPGMDGTEVLRRIRADEALRRLPVVALTAHAMAGDRDRFLRAGFDDYVAKPIMDESVLTNTIARLMP